MISLYFARTDMTGSLTKWFIDRDQAVAWAEEHYADEAYVCQMTFLELSPRMVVYLLNGGEDDSEVIWEKTLPGVPV